MATNTGTSRAVTTKSYQNALFGLGYSFRWNELNDRVEVNGLPLSDGVAAKIRCEMNDRKYYRSEFLEQVIMATAYDNRFHPVRDYLNRLRYDGGDYIKELASCFVNPDGLFPLALRKFLIAACAKAVNGQNQNAMLVLTGKQGIGKSKWTRWLCPLTDYFIEAPIKTNDKDTLLRLGGKWIWEVSELGSTTRTQDLEELKFFLTMGEVTVRRPYGRYDIAKPALASFIGTVNGEKAILNDQTGSRRFMVCEIDHIDWDYTLLDVNQVWAEAYSAFLTGEDWNLTSDERKLFEGNNAKHTVDDPIQLMIEAAFSIDPTEARNKNPTWFETTVTIIHALRDSGNKMQDRALQMEIGKACSRLGLVKGRQGQAGYFGLKMKGVP